MTELTFLVDLLLNHKLPKATRDAVAARIKEVESGLATGHFVSSKPLSIAPIPSGSSVPAHMVGQSASTIAAMLRHEQAGVAAVPNAQEKLVAEGVIAPQGGQSAQAALPVTIVAQTPATAAALSKRQQAINLQVSGKPADGETRPRKW